MLLMNTIPNETVTDRSLTPMYHTQCRISKYFGKGKRKSQSSDNDLEPFSRKLGKIHASIPIPKPFSRERSKYPLPPTFYQNTQKDASLFYSANSSAKLPMRSFCKQCEN